MSRFPIVTIAKAEDPLDTTASLVVHPQATAPSQVLASAEA